MGRRHAVILTGVGGVRPIPFAAGAVAPGQAALRFFLLLIVSLSVAKSGFSTGRPEPGAGENVWAPIRAVGRSGSRVVLGVPLFHSRGCGGLSSAFPGGKRIALPGHRRWRVGLPAKCSALFFAPRFRCGASGSEVRARGAILALRFQIVVLAEMAAGPSTSPGFPGTALRQWRWTAALCPMRRSVP